MYGDIRIAKTQRAIFSAFRQLLERQNFQKITVRDICGEALVSRATFYSHFNDKYDLLKSWLLQMNLGGCDLLDSFEEKEALFNQFFYDNKALIRNLLSAADEDTMRQFLLFWGQFLGFPAQHSPSTPEEIVRSQFFAGGIMQYLSWQIRHNFPEEVPPLNIHLHKIIQLFRE